MKSEVARLKQQITLECEAMKHAVSGYAITGKHEMIQHKYNQLGTSQGQLAQIVGEQRAAEIVASIYVETME
ncbi:hypothetical protein EPA93_10205 [Ktedonosporobacter rubrisoli]|uniref:Uncharacterized protein n=1 Tax=Ktedonosporobacter rubrisoli TaxID=2509675 RepID=A0A4P6JMR7_KTERU|nr:hypothetical protein [Ktedonosporobacter rubrisoli]QBD76360.1 hypothetical protein EPA93_10205 [Ktedonosporobacter rubrisoli]